MSLRDQIVQQALELPPEDRAFVVDALEQSLTNGEFATPEIAAAWAAEVERRSAAYDRGEMPGEDWQVVMARLHERLENSRAARP